MFGLGFARFLWVAVATLPLTGCATIVHGRSQQVHILSEPEGARAEIQPAGVKVVTPAVVKLKRLDDQLVTYKLDGYEPAARQLTTQISPWFFVNMFLGGLPGMAVDFITGGAYFLEPDPVEVELEPAVPSGGHP